MNEIWKKSRLAPNYEVSNLGNVRNATTKESLKFTKQQNGYLGIKFGANTNHKYISVHRLVAYEFCKGYKDGFVVNHKNEIKTDNCADNLEWCSQEYNNKYGSRAKIMKPVLQKDKDGNLINTFSCLKEAQRITGVRADTISYVASGKRKTAGGYKWGFAYGN